MTTIRIDEELLRKAHELGLNVSKVCENALKEAVRRLEGSEPSESSKKCFNHSQNTMVDGAGFEPATSAMPTPRSFQADLPARQTFNFIAFIRKPISVLLSYSLNFFT